MHNADNLLTAKDKAAELGISRSTLSRKVKSGLIVPAFKDESNPRNGVQLFEPEPVNAFFVWRDWAGS